MKKETNNEVENFFEELLNKISPSKEDELKVKKAHKEIKKSLNKTQEELLN